MDMRQAANQQKYDLAASIYDIIAFVMSLGQVKKIYRQVARSIVLNNSPVIVEFGCGPAALTPYLLDSENKLGKIIGIDFSREMIKIADLKKRNNDWENVEFECRDIYDYPDNRKADIVIFCLALTAIPDATRALQKAISILKPGGQIIIADSFPLSSRWWHHFTNGYIILKSMVVGAKPSNKILPFIEENFVGINKKELIGGVYTLLTARKL